MEYTISDISHAFAIIVIVSESILLYFKKRDEKIESKNNIQKINYWHNKSSNLIADFERILTLVETGTHKSEISKSIKKMREEAKYSKYTIALFTEENAIEWLQSLGYLKGRLNNESIFILKIFLERIEKKKGTGIDVIKQMASEILAEQ